VEVNVSDDFQDEEYRVEFVLRRRRYRIARILPLAALLPVGILILVATKTPYSFLAPIAAVLFLVVAVTSAIYGLVTWRCPVCRAPFGRDLGPRFCPTCGFDLDPPL
jgi:hypothetical protein